MIKIDKILERYLLSHIEDESPLLARLYRETQLRMVNGPYVFGPFTGVAVNTAQ